MFYVRTVSNGNLKYTLKQPSVSCFEKSDELQRILNVYLIRWYLALALVT